MSRIPNSAIPHAWAEDSDHAKEVRRARGEAGGALNRMLWLAAMTGLALAAAGFLGARLRKA